MCKLERQASALQVGESYDWDGQQVTLLTLTSSGSPQWIGIDWTD
jgi:hypothetical protein